MNSPLLSTTMFVALAGTVATAGDNLTPHVPAMGPVGAAALGDAGGLLSTWLGLFAASGSTTGAKTTTEKEKRDAKENLAAKLHVALLTIALQKATEASDLKRTVTDANSETTATLYFRPDLLVDPAAPPEDEPPAPTIPKLSNICKPR
jgi:hypothetical protein